MSFILDALRKSENERRLETSPDIMQTPLAVRRDRVPLWAIVSIAGLALALAAVTIYTLTDRGLDTVEQAAAPARPQAQPVLSEPEPAAAERGIDTAPQPVPSEPEPTVAERIVVSAEPPAAAAPAPAAPQPAASTTSATSAGPTAPEPTEAAGASARAAEAPLDVSDLPAYAAVLEEGTGLGALQLQLHVHSSIPTSRFVVINGSRYGEGDRVSDGLVLEAIAAEGAVLSFRGRRFLLTPN